MKKKIAYIVLLSTISLLFISAALEKTAVFYSKSTLKEKTSTKLNGLFKDYYANGNLKAEEYYHNGLREGIWKSYYANGQLKNVISYQEGRFEGKLSYFSDNGELIFTEIYQDGQLVGRNIANDSLYNYEVLFTDHGKSIFARSCTECHGVADMSDSLHTNLKSVSRTLDSLGLNSITMKEIHSGIDSTTDSSSTVEQVENEENISPYPNNYDALDKFDIEALLDYLHKQRKVERFPLIRIKELRKKDKTV